MTVSRIPGCGYPYKAIGNRLKFLRGNATRKEFASVIGISERAYQRYELGERVPNFLTLNRIAVVCGVDLNWILLGGRETSFDDVKNILKEAKETFSDWTLENLINELRMFRVKKRMIKPKLKKPFKEKGKSDPHFSSAIDMLREIFTYGSKDTIKNTISYLEAFSELAVLGIDPYKTTKPNKKRKKVTRNFDRK